MAVLLVTRDGDRHVALVRGAVRALEGEAVTLAEPLVAESVVARWRDSSRAQHERRRRRRRPPVAPLEVHWRSRLVRPVVVAVGLAAVEVGMELEREPVAGAGHVERPRQLAAVVRRAPVPALASDSYGGTVLQSRPPRRRASIAPAPRRPGPCTGEAGSTWGAPING